MRPLVNAVQLTMAKLAGFLVLACALTGCGPFPPPYGEPDGTIDGEPLTGCELLVSPPGTTVQLDEEYSVVASSESVSLLAAWSWNDATAPGTPPGRQPFWNVLLSRVSRDGEPDACYVTTVTQGVGAWILDGECTSGPPLHVEIYRCEMAD